jgi:type I restriction enzyme S subunit
VKNTNNVPRLRFPNFTDAWEQRELNKIVKSIDTGKSKFHSDSNNGEYAILGSTSIIGYDNCYDYDGDFILTARVGANAGSLYRYTGKAKISDNTVFIQAEKNIEFVYYMLTKFDVKQLSFGTGQPLVKASELKNLNLKMPTQIEEQQLIGDYFETLDTLITLHQRKCDKLEEYKKAMLQKIFSQELRFKREGGTNYPEWEQTSLEDVCDIVGGGTPSTKNIDYWNGNIQWFTPSEIGKTKYVSKSVRTISQVGFEKSSARKLPVGTILLTSRATLGEMAIATIECTTNQGFQSLIPRKINGEYLYYLQPTIKNYCNKKACGSTFNEISKGELGKCKIPMPHFEEQQKIADFLSALDEAINYAKQELDKWKELKKGLLQQMFV